MAFFAIVSIGTVGLYIAYALPVFLRLRAGDDFVPGPWNLGRWGKPVGGHRRGVGAFITILFFAPAFYPWNTLVNFNWAGPLFLLLMGVILLWWIVSAHKWFTGPKVQGTPEELAEIERELMEIG